MERRISRVWKPAVELVEGRELLSLVTNIMAGNHNAAINSPKVRELLEALDSPRPAATPRPPRTRRQFWTASTGGGRQGGFVPPRPRSPCRRIRASCTGQPRIQPGARTLRNSDSRRGEAAVIQGRLSRARTASPRSVQQPIHAGDPAVRAPPARCCTATSSSSSPFPATPPFKPPGASAIFDRNLNSNTALGLDCSTGHQRRRPRPAQPHHECHP